jgi:hypothetical protein
MRNIVSLLKESAKNFDKIRELGRRLISSSQLSKCGFHKEKGLSCKTIMTDLLLLAFEKKSLYQKAGKDKEMNGNLKTYYRFLENSKHQWEKLLYEIAEKVVFELSKLTDHRRHVLVIDDSLYERPCSKKVELSAWQFDHVEKVCKKGFRFLTVGWADGYSFVPLMFRLVSSRKTQTVPEGYDKRTIAYRRRVNALKKMNDSAVEFLEKAKTLGAQYVTCDSWFGTPKTIRQIQNIGYDVVSHIKSNYLFYFENGLHRAKYIQQHLDRSKEWCDLSGAQNINPDIEVLGSAKVTFKKGNAPIRLLFCRLKDSKKPNEIAILACTDLTLSSVEILELYAKRWSIEVFFKTCKGFLGFEDETHALNYDTLVASKTICLLRYILITYNLRFEEDHKTFSEMFFLFCDAIKDMCALNFAWELLFAFYERVKDMTVSCLEDFFALFKNFIRELAPTGGFLSIS